MWSEPSANSEPMFPYQRKWKGDNIKSSLGGIKANYMVVLFLCCSCILEFKCVVYFHGEFDWQECYDLLLGADWEER